MDACVNKEIINFVLFIFSQMYQHVLISFEVFGISYAMRRRTSVR